MILGAIIGLLVALIMIGAKTINQKRREKLAAQNSDILDAESITKETISK